MSAANDVSGIVVASIPNGCVAVIWPPVPCVGCGRMAAMLVSRGGHFLCIDCDKPLPVAALSPKRAPIVEHQRRDGTVCPYVAESHCRKCGWVSPLPKRAKPCPSPDCVLAAGHARPCVVEVAAGSVVRAPKRAATKRGRKRR